MSRLELDGDGQARDRLAFRAPGVRVGEHGLRFEQNRGGSTRLAAQRGSHPKLDFYLDRRNVPGSGGFCSCISLEPPNGGVVDVARGLSTLVVDDLPEGQVRAKANAALNHHCRIIR